MLIPRKQPSRNSYQSGSNTQVSIMHVQTQIGPPSTAIQLMFQDLVTRKRVAENGVPQGQKGRRGEGEEGENAKR